MKLFLDQTTEAVTKRRMAVIVSASTTTIIVLGLLVISTLKPSSIFAKTTKGGQIKQVQIGDKE